MTLIREILQTHRFQLEWCGKEWNAFWESNPTNIKYPVFRGNTAITLIFQKTLRDPSLPGDLTSLDTDYTVVSMTNSLNFSESG
jgi:hypothetical protein